MNFLKKRFVQKKGSPIRDFFKDFEDRTNGLADNVGAEAGILLDKDIKGEIIVVHLAPNESKIISHGLRSIPTYRLILRKTGVGEVTDVNENWNAKTIGLRNNSANEIDLTIKLF